jgi:DNA-directed RNA polymerase subunit M/transcription elongation factor TFIIS
MVPKMLTTLASLISSAHELRLITKAVIDAKTDADVLKTTRELNHAIGNIEQQLLAAQSRYSTVLREKNILKKECLRLKDWSIERKSYAVHKMPAGSFVYRKRLAANEPATSYYLCAHCYEEGIKSILQPTTYDEYTMLKCHRCQSSIQVERSSLSHASVFVGNDRGPSDV